MAEEQKKFNAEVRDVFSGDDLMVMVDLGVDDLHKKKRVRLYGVDTPNAVGLGPDTEAGGIRTLVLELVRRRKITLTVVSRTHSSWVCVVEVHTPDSVVNLNDALIAKGYKFNRDKGN